MFYTIAAISGFPGSIDLIQIRYMCKIRRICRRRFKPQKSVYAI